MSAAGAQSYDRYDNDDGYRVGPPEKVEVKAPPHYRAHRSAIGADRKRVAFPCGETSDLYLRTVWGARELRERVRVTARALCERLENAYPIAAEDSPPCYSTALQDAMVQANAAITTARESAALE